MSCGLPDEKNLVILNHNGADTNDHAGQIIFYFVVYAASRSNYDVKRMSFVFNSSMFGGYRSTGGIPDQIGLTSSWKVVV